MSAPSHSPAEIQLAQMVSVWSQGEAAKHDPVLVNMLARHVASLNRIAPGAAEKVLAAFEDMKARGVSLAKATEARS